MQRIHLLDIFRGLNREEKFAEYRRVWKLAADYKVLTSFPLHLDIELSGRCNLSCSHCFQNGKLKGPLGLMDMNLFRRIIDEGVEKGLCAVKLQIRGESLLHPQFDEAVRYAKGMGILDVQVTTNATLLTEKRSREIIAAGLDAIIFSVDTHHGDCMNDYSNVERKVLCFMQVRKELGAVLPWVRVKASLEESSPQAFDEAREHLKQRFPLADLYIVSRLHNFLPTVDAFPDLHKNYEQLPCHYPMQRLAVYWNGETTVCCLDFNNNWAFGDAGAQSIESIWNSERLNTFRTKQQINRQAMPICRHCHACVRVRGNVGEDMSLRHKLDLEVARRDHV